MEYIEVELKYHLSADTADLLKAKLKDLGAIPGLPTRQVDSYYNAPHRDFLAPPVVSEWLRIRETDHDASINFKVWHPVNEAAKTHADEYESTVGNPEAIHRILTSLGFVPLVTVDKTREEWTVPGEVTVAFDVVAGLGTFVEFEFAGEADTVKDALARLDTFTASLGVELGERVNRGYPHMLLGREH